MKSGSKILVGLDGSKRAHGVLAQAAELAEKFDAELILVRAVTVPLETPAEAFELSPDTFLTLLETNARSSLDLQRRGISQGLRVREMVRTGVAWQVVCTTAREENADLIVIGSHGYSGLDRILGTTAERIVDHAECSVLVVREPKVSEGSSPG